MIRAVRGADQPTATPGNGRHRLATLALVMIVWAASATAQTRPAPYEPEIGQGGKDVVWVPTPPALVETMLDMAGVAPDDVVMDLGSGDGRNIIAAAKRGARAIGVEYNPDMVALATRLADEAGVAERATFIEGDMFTADISQATVMALFLLPDNLERLRRASRAVGRPPVASSRCARPSRWCRARSRWAARTRRSAAGCEAPNSPSTSTAKRCTAWFAAHVWKGPGSPALEKTTEARLSAGPVVVNNQRMREETCPAAIASSPLPGARLT
ncbi:MAG: class I SAM-dependent methyltransferase [Acidobacteria bacterium]|nr:class I SAM-dependent methyltransferase [Acidobacteriota bacterium]